MSCAGATLPRIARVLLAQALAAFMAIASLPSLAADVPYLTGRVVDNAEILKAATRASIDATLQAHESKSSDQIAVLTTRSLGGESIEAYAQQVFSAWKLGQKGKDNGILLIVAPAEHRMRIEVGYGLEGTLPDVIASRIIRDVMTPAFRNDDFDGGVQKGVDAIVAQLEGRADATMPALAAADVKRPIVSVDGGEPNLAWPMKILIGAFIFGILGVFTFMGIITPGVGWFLYLFLIPFWAMFPFVVVGQHGALWVLGTYLIGFPIAKLIARGQPWYAKASADLKKSGTANVGGWVISSGGSSSGGGGGGGGGGFSGGGGSSGGGGASGSW